ncbi:MAG: TetR/AcrR family transcriptional regulator [Solobacterium sp.]|nr:TetR/AcrR family transcriptional regulator [Solobacterium sp.]MDD5982225.1 TetR/AcrR family transcriptional regulator [Solobacterium sp.]MDD6121137.1 TetR/AcrR family transcriptional regulator [Solobacterium sp.]MDD6498340.1 TetR/AcrR family transcriptional regulator [Solobacterium sp.]MDD6834018.1 TetR/AcrR family transcriptional regulator [Solobacterium sp.]
MDRGNTKQEILDVALELFSRQGYEATSISSIADAVGIRKASLYSHFSSKQAILDEIVKIVLEKYDSHSFVLKKGMDNMPKNCDEAVAMIKGQIHYIANDPLISKARKMLTIEQFRNAELSKLLTKQNYTDIMNFFTAMVQSLIEAGVLVKGDREAMAASLCLPVSAWLNVLDRDGEKEDEILMLIDRHVREFFRIYGI